MSDYRNALNAPIRPGGSDVRGQQPTLLPFDAFDFDDPNKTAEPELRVKAPWKFVAEAEITTEALQAIFVEASEIIIGYQGSDPDNPVVGDRRLIIKAFVLSLQNYNPDGDGAYADGWVDDISLGGFDKTSTFVDYIQAAGISQDREDALLQPKGLGLPAPLTVHTQQSVVANNSGTVQRGTYAGEPFYERGTYGASPEGNTDFSNAISWPSVDYSGNQTYSEGVSVPGEMLDVIDFDKDAFDIAGVDLLLWRFSVLNYLHDDADDLGQSDAIWMAYFGSLTFYVEPITYEIRVDVSNALVNTRNPIDLTETSSVYTGIYLEDGINRFTVRAEGSVHPNFDNLLQNVYYRQQIGAMSNLLINQKATSGEYAYSDNFVGSSVQNTTSVTGYPVWARGSQTFTAYTSQNGLAACHITTGFSFEAYATASFRYFSPINYVSSAVEWIPDTYISDVYYLREDYFRLVDRFRDIALIPSSLHGKTVILEGGNVPESFSDKYVSVVGKTGLQGDQGDQGEDGPAGASFTDGGTFSTNYLPDQEIDGGGF